MPEELEVQALCGLLAKECGSLGLTAEVLAPTRVRVGATNAGMLAEVIRCQPDGDEILQWCWSWDTPFCVATPAEIGRAARMIAHVVTPAHA